MYYYHNDTYVPCCECVCCCIIGVKSYSFVEINTRDTHDNLLLTPCDQISHHLAY